MKAWYRTAKYVEPVTWERVSEERVRQAVDTYYASLEFGRRAFDHGHVITPHCYFMLREDDHADQPASPK